MNTKYKEYFKNINEFLEYWDRISVMKKNQLVEGIVFGKELHYCILTVGLSWYMTNKNDDSVVTELNIPNYVEDISEAWKIAEKLGIALVPQSKLTGSGFNWLAMDIEIVLYRGEVVLYPRRNSEISKPSASEAICLSAIISLLELSDE